MGKKNHLIILTHLIKKAYLLQSLKINNFMSMSLRYVLQDAMLSDSVFQALHEQLKCLKRVISRFPIKLLPQEKFSTDAKVVQIHRYYILLTVFKENWFIQDTRISKLTYFFPSPVLLEKKKNSENVLLLQWNFRREIPHLIAHSRNCPSQK